MGSCDQKLLQVTSPPHCILPTFTPNFLFVTPRRTRLGKLLITRYAPEELRSQYKCRKPSKFYFYNVSSATCEALSGVCTTSQNKFPTFDSCMKSCIVQSEDLSQEE